MNPIGPMIRQPRFPGHFEPQRPVPDALLGRIMSRAGRAPSPGNLQPWRFVIVRAPAGRRLLRRSAFGDVRFTEAPVGVIALGFHHPQRTHGLEVADGQVRARGLLDADAARIAALSARVFEGAPDPSVPATRAAMLAVAALLAAAEGFGLAATLADRFDHDALRDRFGIPDDHTPCALAALGYPIGPIPELGRLPIAELCFEGHFGQPWNPVEDLDALE